ncbi:hypothetical protein [Streptomyces sp. SID9124]|uniref:hypothetical protein n=1 Tax=Streptomyces sp. SID9124 TaxID=2706108 RepID=UPI0013DF9665|nr:hypothetical protein [Streptomyces sp. SID9124]NED14581.1 hypothetical protein [Streptomyces sp. SID9124]
MATLRRWRTVAGAIIYFGLFSFRDVGFGSLNDIVWAAPLAYPLTIGVMLLIWRRRGYAIRPLWTPIGKGLRLLAAYVAVLLLLVELTIASPVENPSLPHVAVAFWLLCFFIFATLAVARNFFGSAAVHPALPGLLTTVVAWQAALLRLTTSTEGLVYVVGGPATLTVILALELSRLRHHHGIRLSTCPGFPDGSGQA